MKICANIKEISYKNNWIKSESDVTRKEVLIESKFFETIDEAIKYFNSRYHWKNNIVLLKNGNLVLSRGIMICDTNGWKMPSLNEMEAFRNGTKDLWYVEYHMCL